MLLVGPVSQHIPRQLTLLSFFLPPPPPPFSNLLVEGKVGHMLPISTDISRYIKENIQIPHQHEHLFRDALRLLNFAPGGRATHFSRRPKQKQAKSKQVSNFFFFFFFFYAQLTRTVTSGRCKPKTKKLTTTKITKKMTTEKKTKSAHI